jgi:hypothetical protein
MIHLVMNLNLEIRAAFHLLMHQRDLKNLFSYKNLLLLIF